MRIKTLILTAAMAILGSAACMAQVYSQNAVGFYTINLLPGWNLIANQLDNQPGVPDGINDVLPWAGSQIPDGASALKWNPSTQTFPSDVGYVATFYAGYGWYFDPTTPSEITLEAGEGLFIFVPGGSPADAVLVGDVPQGDNLTKDLVQGWNMVSQLTPQAMGLSEPNNEMPAGESDTLLFWNAELQGYIIPGETTPSAYTYFEGYGWTPDGINIVNPTPAIGEAMFYQKVAAGTDQWIREFSVN
jgi:hypothetical protein